MKKQRFKVGRSTEVSIDGRSLLFFRMPSTSRAYPLSLDKKAAAYETLFRALNLV